MASNNQNSTGGDLAAMMEVDAKAREADFAKADALIKQVPDALKVDDCEKAVDLCSRALKLKSAHLDERDPDLADLYYEYGRCLLTKAQRRAEVFGDVAQQKIEEKASEGAPTAQNDDDDDDAMDAESGDEEAPNDDDDDDEDNGEGEDNESDDEGDEDAAEVPAASSSPGDAKKQKSKVDDEDAAEDENGSQAPLTEQQKRSLMDNVKRDGADDDDESNTQNAKAVPLFAESNQQADRQATATEPQEKKKEGDQQPDDLELAWDVLELARVLFEQSGRKSRVSDVHMCLGEISMEGDNMQVAAEEFQKCVDIRKRVQPYDARALAEAHFFLALAYEHSTEGAAAKAREATANADPQDIMAAVINAAASFDADAYQEFAEKAVANLKEARRILNEELTKAMKENRPQDVEDLPSLLEEMSAKIEVIETKAPPEAEMQDAHAPAPAFNFGSDFGSGPATTPPTSFDLTQAITGRAEKPVRDFSLSLDASKAGASSTQFAKFELPANTSFSWTPTPATDSSSNSLSGFALPSSGAASSAPPAFSFPSAGSTAGFTFPVVSGGKQKSRVAPTMLPTQPSSTSSEETSGGLKRKADEVSGGLDAADTPSKKPNLGQ